MPFLQRTCDARSLQKKPEPVETSPEVEEGVEDDYLTVEGHHQLFTGGELHGEGREDGGGGGQGDSLGQAPAHVGEPEVEND